MNEKTTAVKFGGSSLCDAKAFDRAANIIKADPSRRFVTVSAPGKRFPGDEKITDMLYRCFRCSGDEFMYALEKIKGRFDSIIKDLSVTVSLENDFSELIYGRKNYFGRDYFASRGEYFCAKIFASYLGYGFIDAAECICFGEDGAFLPETTAAQTSAKLKAHHRAVIPGFYGSMPGGTIKTFARGGSDITGAILAAACGADIYENWTDVPGFMSADPKTVDNPKTISIITYKELRRLSFMGAGVLHEDAVLPLRGADIPVAIKSTLAPDEKGTLVVPDRMLHGEAVCGIAGKCGFVTVFVGKDRIGYKTDDRRRILEIFGRRGISVAGMFSGVDCAGFCVPVAELSGRTDYIRNEICQYAEPEYVTVGEPCALISIVGAAPQNMLPQIFSSVKSAGARILCADVGTCDGGVTVGIDEKHLDETIKSLYNNLIG